MKPLYFKLAGLCVLCLSVAIAAMAVDQRADAQVSNDKPNCDNECRERNAFKACDSDTHCYFYTDDEKSCFYCSNQSSYRCKPQLSDKLGQCSPTSVNIILNRTETCNRACPCDILPPPTSQFVEAILPGSAVAYDSVVVTKYSCK